VELPAEDGTVKSMTSWIPEKYAVKDKFLELKDRETGEWINGWRVCLVGTARLSEETVIAQSQNYKKTRIASDI